MAKETEQGTPPRTTAQAGPKRARPSWVPETPPAKITLAMKALVAGSATADQQRIGMDWIINTLCGTYDWPFRPGPEGHRETDIALGRQLVGKSIVHEINISGTLLKTRGENHG